MAGYGCRDETPMAQLLNTDTIFSSYRPPLIKKIACCGYEGIGCLQKQSNISFGLDPLAARAKPNGQIRVKQSPLRAQNS